MKKSIIIIAAILMAGFSTKVMAQTANGTGSQTEATLSKAVIITPIAISHTGELNFGTMAVLNGTTGGTCTMSPIGADRTTTGDVNLSGGGASVPTFTVTGQASTNFRVTLPAATFYISKIGGDGSALQKMLVSTLKVSMDGTTEVAANLATGQIGATNKTFTLGATIAAAPGQVNGSYQGSFDVTVAYN